MNKHAARKKIIGTVAMFGLVCTQARAKEAVDFSSMYKQRIFGQICTRFEANNRTHWGDPNAAYYYALALFQLGKTDSALSVCKEIQARYPLTAAAKQARVAIHAWSLKPARLAVSSQKPDRVTLAEKLREPGSASVPDVSDSLGIVGVKFIIGFGIPATINQVFPSTPAEQAGLKEKDIIAAVDGVPTTGLSKEEIFAMIAGPPDAYISMTIIRNGESMTRRMKRIRIDELKASNPDTYRLYLRQ